MEGLEDRQLLAGDLLLVNHFELWDGGVVPSSDVAGVAYHAPSGHLFLSDSEINEIPSIFDGDNAFEISLTGDELFGAYATGNSEPTGITYNEFDGFFYVTNDDTQRITRYDSTLEDSQGSVKTTSAVSSAKDPEGITSDPITGTLYVVDGSLGARQVLVYTADLDYQYRFSVKDRMADSEGIALNPYTNTLFIVSEPDMSVFEYTVNGGFVNQYDISGFSPAPVAPQGLTFAPTSNPNDDPNAFALYIADGMQDNHADGQIYEAIVIGAGENGPPQVHAGTDQSIVISESVVLNGTVSDDGLPDPPAGLTTNWTKVSGPGTVTFNNAAAVDTTATFSQTGSYVLQLSADDGELTHADQVSINVTNAPVAPVTVSFQDGVGGYSGTRDTSITGDMPTTNLGTLSELEVDGRPDYAALMAWDIRSIPAGSTILSASITVQVTNPSNASYELFELKQNWSETEATWEAFASGSNWQAAGAQGSNDMGSTVLGQANMPSTGQRTITLNQAGIALVQAWVDNAASNRGIIAQDYVGPTNGLHFSSREVSNTSNRPKLTIEYQPNGPQANAAPQVNAGPDQSVLVSESVALSGTVNDDGLPNPPNNVTTTWTKISGPGTVTFNNSAAVNTSATFSQSGSYVLQLTADDGELSATDQVTVTVSDVPVNQPPQVNAGPDQSVLITGSVALNGTVSDDGLPNPPNNVTTTWTKVSGPGTVTFNDSAAVDTSATFSQTGSYVLQLTAADGALSNSDQLTVTVTDVPAGPVTVSFQDGVGGYSGTRDTSITGDMPTTNLGTLSELEVDGRPDYAALMAWDIHSIPAGSTILSASITVQVTNPSNASYELFELKQNWSETEATWEAFASGSNWQTSGAQGSNDMGSTVLGQANMPSTGKRTITLNQAGIALVQAWVDNAASNHGLIFQDYVGPTNGLHFSSREVSNVGNRPKLTIEYQSNGPQANAAPQVNAGLDQSVLITGSVTLNGTVSDDGLPNPPGSVTTTWTQVSGPGTVTFSNSAAVDTSATFSQTGSYVLQLTADDGELSNSDQLTVNVTDVPAGPVTVSFQDGVGGYSGTRDTSITGDMPTTNLGTLSELEVDGSPDYAVLLAWDISTVPTGSSVLSASITVNVTNPSNAAYEIFGLKRGWSETEATWTAFSSGSNWQAPGAQGSNDMGSTILGQANMPSTGKRTITLNQAGIALVQSWVDNAASNHGLIFQDYVGPTNGLHFDSREVSNTSNRPELRIQYEPL